MLNLNTGAELDAWGGGAKLGIEGEQYILRGVD